MTIIVIVDVYNWKCMHAEIRFSEFCTEVSVFKMCMIWGKISKC
jgi:hypothetical protein